MSYVDTELRAGMLRWARGDLSATAAVRLLIDTGLLPEKLADADCVRPLSTKPGAMVIAPMFSAALDSEELADQLSHSECALLELAASLNGSYSVGLRTALGVLDNTNKRHALAAFRTALGVDR